MMEMTFTLESTFNSKAVAERVKSAMELGLRDLTVKVTHDAVIGSPVRTGNNRHSIAYNVGMEAFRGGAPETGQSYAMLEPPPPPLMSYVYSTSGYGGLLETGHRTRSGSMVAARPYFKPALDMNIDSYGDMVGKYLK